MPQSLPSAIKDANELVASVAFRLSENIVIYPITPSSPMAELCDEWAENGRKNLWNATPAVAQMQSEGGAAGAVHGFLQAGAMGTTFTASQGLLLMIPNMYKIAGELTPFCMHVTARSLATHALSIFGDHSDVMACRQTGFAMLCSGSVQEAQDFAAIAHAATLRSRIPFLHFFDGFRTSHEINTATTLDDATLRALIDDECIAAHRKRALNPDAPAIRGTAQNPDAFFQAREAVNSYYDRLPAIVEETMETFARLTGRTYKPFDYEGDPEATDVVIALGSGAETTAVTAAALNRSGRRTGVLRVRLFRPFALDKFLAALPLTTQRIAVLDRTKEPGALGEPLYQDIQTALASARAEELVPPSFQPLVIGGRYGLGSKEFAPPMARAVFDNLAAPSPKNHFTVGIVDDVTHTSLEVDPDFSVEEDDVFRAVFLGLGSDGTVGANKNSIKIIGSATGAHAQAYFVYDSKKAGAMTVSHLRFGPRPIRAPYLISSAGFVACHQFSFIHRIDVLERAAPGAVFLLNAPGAPDTVWDRLPREMQETIIARNLQCYTIDAYAVAREAGMGNRINTIMQTCFFAISGILEKDEAIAQIKQAIESTYGRKGRAIVERNFGAVDTTLANLHRMHVAEKATARHSMPPPVDTEAPDFVRKVTGLMLAGKGDLLPVSAFPADGTWPTATSQWEKRGLARLIPSWEPDLCIQCGKCALVCPHAAIRAKAWPESCGTSAPDSFLSREFKSKDLPGHRLTIQTAPDDCTGCRLCVNICPAKDRANPSRKALNMTETEPVLENERTNYSFFLSLPETDVSHIRLDVKSSQLRRPLFEYSGACSGCGETPYIKLLTQLMGDRLLIANATGCSSIYSGNLPTTPYATDSKGRGPAWSNSLFEDNAEFGFGMRMAVDYKTRAARDLVAALAPYIGDSLASAILDNPQTDDPQIESQRAHVGSLLEKLPSLAPNPDALLLAPIASYLVRKSVWCVGGDGWAYDIGFGGLDHVLASNANLNILVLDTEVYSNTGGQSSKATPMGAVAKFAAGGKAVGKKDLGLHAMGYGHAYVAAVAMGAKDNQTVQALAEADAHPGPSLVIAYSHCVAHGYDMAHGLEQQKLAVQTGYWPIYRFDPKRHGTGEPALKLDCPPPKTPLHEYMHNELRFRILAQSNPDHASTLASLAQERVRERFAHYQTLASSATDTTTSAKP